MLDVTADSVTRLQTAGVVTLAAAVPSTKEENMLDECYYL